MSPPLNLTAKGLPDMSPASAQLPKTNPIVVVDTGGANLHSVMIALEALGIQARLSSDPDSLQSASRVILPGVGAALATMERLKKTELIQSIRSVRKPLLGICLGMQILFEHSEEGEVQTLGLIPGGVQAFSKMDFSEKSLSLPHMGWNTLDFGMHGQHPLFQGLPKQSYMYFVHSYFVPESTEHCLAHCTYGEKRFAAIVQKDHIYGMQFHPEKSALAGRQLLRNFCRL